MSEKGKLFVFDRIEVLIILLLMILVAVTSFTFGVKIGQKFTYESQGFSDEERQLIELKSAAEEEAEQIENQGINESEIEKMNEESLQRKFEDIEKGSIQPGSVQAERVEEVVENPQSPVASERENLIQDLNNKAYEGKWSIQLGSYQSNDDAQRFADGFRARGYNPIINEVNIQGRGIWFRVALGIFDSVSDAREYIAQEASLFQGQDYTIVKLQ